MKKIKEIACGDWHLGWGIGHNKVGKLSVDDSGVFTWRGHSKSRHGYVTNKGATLVFTTDGESISVISAKGSAPEESELLKAVRKLTDTKPINQQAMKRYSIWKASIDTYRVHDTRTGLIKVVGEFAAVGCTFHVDDVARIEAERNGYKNSGDPLDYFAWIEADQVTANAARVLYPAKVFFNPFRVSRFVNRATGAAVHAAQIVTAVGNTLSFKP